LLFLPAAFVTLKVCLCHQWFVSPPISPFYAALLCKNYGQDDCVKIR